MSIVNAVLGQLDKVKGAQFASITYRAKKTGELARFFCVLGADTGELYKKDVAALAAMIPATEGLAYEAAVALLNSRQESLAVGIGNNSKYTHAPHAGDTYVYPKGLAGVRVHKETGAVYLNVLVQNRVVLEPGVYKPVNSKPLTLAKKEIEATLPSSRFRQFIISHVAKCACAKTVVEADTMELVAADEASGPE